MASEIQLQWPGTELRLEVYRHTWEPAVVVLALTPLPTNWRPPQRKPPVTLSINYEARQETLRHYYQYQCSYSRDGRRIVHQGYINPQLDILLLMDMSAGSVLVRSNLTLEFCGLKQALLHITLSSDDLDGLVRVLHAHGLLRLIKTIDFWISVPGGYTPRGWDERLTVAYRRAMEVDGPVLVEWEDAVFRPAVENPSTVTGDVCHCFDCFRLGSHTPTFWRWRYSPEASAPTTNIAVNFSLSSQPPNPNAATELRAPAAVSHWFDRNARSVLRKTGAIQFDRHPFQHDISTQTSHGESWSLFMVVSHREVTGYAFKSLFDAHGRVDGAHAIQDGFVNHVLSKLKLIKEGRRSINVDGVCAPGYLNENEILNLDGQEERYDTPGNSWMGRPMYPSLIGTRDFPLVSNALENQVCSGDSMAEEAADRICTPHEIQLAREDHWIVVNRRWHRCVMDEA